MQKRVVKAGRPAGTTTFDVEVASAFGAIVRERRLKMGFSQEGLAHEAKVERSHMGKIERGQHLPNLMLIIRLASILDIKPGKLVDLTVGSLPDQR